MVAPEALLLELAGNDPVIGRLIGSTGPLVAPYDNLVQDEGWLVDPAGPQAITPFDDPGLETGQRAINAMLVACDYAVRRGASDPLAVQTVLARESPIAVVAPETDTLPGRLARQLGIGVQSAHLPIPAFTRRKRAHAELSFPCDPVLSFQPRTLDWDMGDNSLSSFIVHSEGESDGLYLSGELSERWGVAVGLPPTTPAQSLPEIELEVAKMPSFLSGVTSLLEGQALEVGWAAGEAPEIEQIGECIRVWTKALFDLDAVEVRIVFAPPRGRSAVLNEMRTRARSVRSQRGSMLSGGRREAQMPHGPAGE